MLQENQLWLNCLRICFNMNLNKIEQILDFCKSPKNITQITNKTKLNRGTLKHYLKRMELFGFIEKSYLLHSSGKPAQIKSLKIIIKSDSNKIVIQGEIKESVV